MDAPELAREVNKRIYEVAEYGDDIELDFLCECGCMGTTPRRPSEYAGGEAFREGHEARTPAGSGRGSRLVPDGPPGRRYWSRQKLYFDPSASPLVKGWGRG